MGAMTTYVAFLRAINLGATRTFPKEAIVTATEAAGFTGVATHINTGNVRLETRMRSRARIEAALEASYAADRGFAVPTIAVRDTELRAIGEDADRLGAGHAGRQYVSLLKDDPDPARVAELEAQVQRRRAGAGRSAGPPTCSWPRPTSTRSWPARSRRCSVSAPAATSR